MDTKAHSTLCTSAAYSSLCTCSYLLDASLVSRIAWTAWRHVMSHNHNTYITCYMMSSCVSRITFSPCKFIYGDTLICTTASAFWNVSGNITWWCHHINTNWYLRHISTICIKYIGTVTRFQKSCQWHRLYNRAATDNMFKSCFWNCFWESLLCLKIAKEID